MNSLRSTINFQRGWSISFREGLSIFQQEVKDNDMRKKVAEALLVEYHRLKREPLDCLEDEYSRYDNRFDASGS